MSTGQKQVVLPTLSDDVKGTSLAFHSWCVEELRRRRSRDLELDDERYARAMRVVLDHLAGRPGDLTP